MEQRQHPRYPARWPCVLILDSAPGKFYHGRTHDVSEAGAAILTDHNLHTDSHFTLMLSVPPADIHLHPMVLEFRCHMAYSVHSDRHCCFRHGITFVGFKGAAKVELIKALHKFFPVQVEA